MPWLTVVDCQPRHVNPSGKKYFKSSIVTAPDPMDPIDDPIL